MADYKEKLLEDARLIILQELAQETSYSLRDTAVRDMLELAMIDRELSWVREQLLIMEDLGAIKTKLGGTVMVAILTKAGLAHTKRRRVIDSISKPEPD